MKKNQHLKFFFAILFFMVIAIRGIEAANYVKVATIGSHPGIVDKSKGMQYVVDQVIEFWRGELPSVLPDKPDLIVLPEACDRPSGLTREEQFDYYRIRKNQMLDFFASVAKEHQCYIVPERKLPVFKFLINLCSLIKVEYCKTELHLIFHHGFYYHYG